MDVLFLVSASVGIFWSEIQEQSRLVWASYGAGSLLLRKFYLGPAIPQTAGLYEVKGFFRGPLRLRPAYFRQQGLFRIFLRLGIFRTGDTLFGEITLKMGFFPSPFQGCGKGHLSKGYALCNG
jgi:hypothetical protein